MFEREFEIIVPQNFEICLERIHTLKKKGCFRALFQPIDAFVYSKVADAEFVIRQSLGRNAGYAVINGVAEPLDDGTTRVVGVAKLEGIIFMLILFNLAALAFIIQDVIRGYWWFLAFTAVWYPLAMYQQIYYRDRLIKTLETALIQ